MTTARQDERFRELWRQLEHGTIDRLDRPDTRLMVAEVKRLRAELAELREVSDIESEMAARAQGWIS